MSLVRTLASTGQNASNSNEEVGVVSVTLRRHVTADPASVALILAGPTVREADVTGDTGVLRLVSDHSADTPGVVVAAPRRNGVGFLASIDVSDGHGGRGRGAVRVAPAGDAGCDIELTLDAAFGSYEPVDAVRREAQSFLDELVKRARSRAYAA